MAVPKFVSVSSINRNAVVSLILALIAAVALCVGLLPIPFTILICYPPGVVLGFVALYLGIKAQREIRADGKNGRTLAVIAVWLSGLSLLSFVCMVMAGITLAPRVWEYISQLFN